jgi:acetyl-CoA carboxylase carboxyltransferase component
MGIVKEKIKDLKTREARILEMGGEKLVAKHKEKGKLTARERMASCSTREPFGRSTCSFGTAA